MKKFALLLLLLSADLAFGQATYYPVSVAFPQIAIGGDNGGDHYVTLLQLVNNNSAGTTGHLALYSDSGSALSALFDGQGPQSALDVTLAPGEARQIQLTLDGPITPGWLAIDYSPSDALTTVILQYRSGETLRSEVGVQPSFSTVESADVAVETDDATSGSLINVGIAIANPGSTTANVFVGLWDPNTGGLLTSATIALPPKGHVSRFLGELFPNVLAIAHMRAKLNLDSCSSPSCAFIGGNGFVATVLRLNGDQFTTVPVAERTDSGDQIRVLPQVAFGGPSNALNMKTVLYFTTNVPTGVFGTADIFDDDGNPLAASADGGAPSSSIPFTVLGNRVSRIVLSGGEILRPGWIRLTLSASVHLIASAIFQTFSGPNLVSEASVLESNAITQGLIYAKSQSDLSNVGVAFANSQTIPNTITLRLFNRDGSVAAVRDITLPANGHLARFVTEIFPEIASIPDFDGALSMASSTAFTALALRLSLNKLATLPVAIDGMYRPSITGLRVTRTQRSPVQVDFAIDVADFDSDVVTSSSTAVSSVAGLDFGNGTFTYDISPDGTALINRSSGTITGSLRPTDIPSVSSGTQAYFLIRVFDAMGNQSNLIYTLIRF